MKMGFPHTIDSLSAQSLFQQLPGEKTGAITQLYIRYWFKPPPKYMQQAGATKDKWKEYLEQVWWKEELVEKDTWTEKPNLYGVLHLVFKGEPALAEGLYQYLCKGLDLMHWRM